MFGKRSKESRSFRPLVVSSPAFRPLRFVPCVSSLVVSSPGVSSPVVSSPAFRPLAFRPLAFRPVAFRPLASVVPPSKE